MEGFPSLPPRAALKFKSSRADLAPVARRSPVDRPPVGFGTVRSVFMRFYCYLFGGPFLVWFLEPFYVDFGAKADPQNPLNFNIKSQKTRFCEGLVSDPIFVTFRQDSGAENN